MALSNQDIPALDSKIPDLAKSALSDAYAASLKAGNTVMIKSGTHIVAVSPDGTHRIVKPSAARRRIARGSRYRLR